MKRGTEHQPFKCGWGVVGPYEIRDNENADGITESDNKNGIYRFFFFIIQESIKSNKDTI